MIIDYEKILQGRYEAERMPKDFSPERIVPDFAFNVLNPLGLLYRPVVDEHYLENGGKKPEWPQGKPFAVCLTHDVDFLFPRLLRQSLRVRKVQILNGTSLSNKSRGLLGPFVDVTRMLKNVFKKVPPHDYVWWLECEKQIGAHSTFFFWPGLTTVTKYHSTDCFYEPYDTVIYDGVKCTVSEMLGDMNGQGCEIGLHPSWYSFDNPDELKRQKEALEKAVDVEIVSVRQHYLHYDILRTPRAQTDAGFKYDSTLGFNDNVGFRFGTSYPWYLYDLRDEKVLTIMEIPLLIQDSALLHSKKGMRLDEETAFQYIVQIAESVEGVGGILTLLWHTMSINQIFIQSLYLRILQYLHKKEAWFASIKEVGEWWEKKA